MLIRKITLLFISMIAFNNFIWSQQDVHFSLYRYHMNMFNPAVTGDKGESFLNMSYKSQWHDIKDAPETQVISFGTPLVGERAGIGFNIIKDATFIENQTSFFVNFSLQLPLSDKSNLFLGIQAGGNNFRINGSNLMTLGKEGLKYDPLLQDHSQFSPNVGAGLYIQSPKAFFSLSAPKILSTKKFIEEEGFYTAATERVHTYISAGRHFSLSDNWTLTPYFLSRFVNDAPLFTSLNIALTSKDGFELGSEYNLGSSMAGSLIFKVGSLSFGYAYTRSIHQEINQYTVGSHELLLKIMLGSKVPDLGIAGNEGDPKDKHIGTSNKENNNISKRFTTQ